MMAFLVLFVTPFLVALAAMLTYDWLRRGDPTGAPPRPDYPEPPPPPRRVDLYESNEHGGPR